MELLKVVAQILELYFILSNFSQDKDYPPYVPQFDITQIKWWYEWLYYSISSTSDHDTCPAAIVEMVEM